MKCFLLGLVISGMIVAATSDGVKVHYTSHGKGSKTVILVHGWTCNESSWSEQIPALSKEYRVITMDLPGHGKTPLPEDGKLTIDRFARAIEAVRAEAKAGKVVVAGHSMGTPVVMQYGRLFPQHVSALVFVDGLVTMGPNPPRIDTKAFQGESGKKNRENMVRGMFTSASTPEMKTKVSEMMLGTPEATAVAAMDAMFDPAAWKNDTFEMPVLGLYADKSRAANQTYMKEHFPKMELHQIPGSGHFLMMEKPEEFNKLLLEFLARQKF
jgi:pimeloyl-ACP methyl ester carboxylesterase